LKVNQVQKKDIKRILGFSKNKATGEKYEPEMRIHNGEIQVKLERVVIKQTWKPSVNNAKIEDTTSAAVVKEEKNSFSSINNTGDIVYMYDDDDIIDMSTKEQSSSLSCFVTPTPSLVELCSLPDSEFVETSEKIIEWVRALSPEIIFQLIYWIHTIGTNHGHRDVLVHEVKNIMGISMGLPQYALGLLKTVHARLCQSQE